MWVRIGKQHALLFADISSTIDLTIRQHQQLVGRALLHYSLRKPETSPIKCSCWQFSADDPVHVFTDTFGHKSYLSSLLLLHNLTIAFVVQNYRVQLKEYLIAAALLLHPAIISMTSFNTIYEVIKPGLYFEHKSTPYSQTILRTWGASSRPPMPIYAVGIAQVPSRPYTQSYNTPTWIRGCWIVIG